MSDTPILRRPTLIPHRAHAATRPRGADPSAYERSYRRGVAQAMSLAADLVLDCETIQEAKRVMRRAEDVAQELREDLSRGGGALLDELGREVRSGNRTMPSIAGEGGTAR